jgi:hypothetical protein
MMRPLSAAQVTYRLRPAIAVFLIACYPGRIGVNAGHSN